MPHKTVIALANQGQNPHGYRAEVSHSGDAGIYDEVSVAILDRHGVCVGYVLVGLTASGEPRVLCTSDGEGDSDHTIAVYPLRPAAEAAQRFN